MSGSKTPFDAVVTYHHRSAWCGVAKFNARLAQELGVPDVSPRQASQHTHPLWSIKGAEVPWLARWRWLSGRGRYSLFLHDIPSGWWGRRIVRQAVRVYAANIVIAEWCARWRPVTMEAFCPSLIQPAPQRDGRYRVLTFGMARTWARQRAEYLALKRRLDEEGRDYVLQVSTAIHEGDTWEDAQAFVSDMRGIFGDRVEPLGYLGDAPLARVMRDADEIALFFAPAVRANNTTYWAALDSGTLVTTNWDDDSPLPDAPHSWEDLMTRMGARQEQRQ